MKKQPTKWKEVFANHTSNKVFVASIHKNTSQLNKKKQARRGDVCL
jgi:hypothetical protein